MNKNLIKIKIFIPNLKDKINQKALFLNNQNKINNPHPQYSPNKKKVLSIKNQFLKNTKNNKIKISFKI